DSYGPGHAWPFAATPRFWPHRARGRLLRARCRAGIAAGGGRALYVAGLQLLPAGGCPVRRARAPARHRGAGVPRRLLELSRLARSVLEQEIHLPAEGI